MGREQVSARTGRGYRLAEWLNANWPLRVSLTNEEFARKYDIKSPNIVSMWRTGKTRVALAWLPDLAALMEVDLAFLLEMWIEQSVDDTDNMKAIEMIFARLKAASSAPSLPMTSKPLVLQPPVASDAEDKTSFVSTRVTEAKHKEFKLAAINLGMSLGDYIVSLHDAYQRSTMVVEEIS